MDVATALIAVDWGTSSLRAYRLGDQGRVVETRVVPRGIMTVDQGAHGAVLAEATDGWGDAGTPVLLSGMIGSRQGWREAPYVDCPATLETIAAAVRPAADGAPAIVPGVRQEGVLPGVMRGEETQILGAIAGDERAVFVLPGTHSKWVSVADRRIERFRTCMTGELFAVLRDHSILGRFATGERRPAAPSAAFAEGVATALAGGDSINALLFTARSLVLAERLAPADSLDYLSGLLIGEEVRSAVIPPGSRPVLLGDRALCQLYVSALRQAGTDAAIRDDPAPAGLWRIAVAAGLVDPRRPSARDARR